MEVYILDNFLRRTQVVDVFESLIWTERYAEIGDFELKLTSTLEARSQFTTGTKLAINESYRVMVVETVEDDVDADGRATLDIKGRSLELILEDRVAKNTMDDLTLDPTWVITDTPGDVARTMFNHICVDGALDINDIIPFITPGSIFSEDTFPEPIIPITWEQKPDLLYTAIKAVCDYYDLGFRLVRNFDMSQLYFNIYSGNDRTTRQTDLPPVVFSPDLDNLQNTKDFTSIQGAKNMAYVFSEVGSAIVYAEGVDPDSAGFERRILLVQASDVTVDTVDIPGALQQKGLEELSQHRGSSIFDGELSSDSNYRYDVDYLLGDIVEMRNKDGVTSYKRVTEQIFASDAEGDRMYPTLSMDLLAAANTWASQGDIQWIDFTTEHWAEM